jgi:methionyl-tRNA formyltransferase
MKIFCADYELITHNFLAGSIISSENHRISVALNDGVIHITEIQMPGKRKMDSASFLRGFKNISEYRFT